MQGSELNDHTSYSSALLWSIELSDTNVYERHKQALLGTASHVREVVVAMNTCQWPIPLDVRQRGCELLSANGSETEGTRKKGRKGERERERGRER